MDILASVTGNPVEAVITVYDRRPITGEDAEPGENTEVKVNPSLLPREQVFMVEDLIDDGLDSLPMNPDLLLETPYNPCGSGTCKKSIKVQFNPATITIQGQGGGKAQITNFGGSTKKGKIGGNSITYSKVDPRITVTIPLVFDAENNADAFLQDKFIINPTSFIKNMGSAIASIFGDGFSVQKQVEGLVAILRNEYTREICFTWSNMSYYGLINGVNVQYTMFSPTGKPIRAVVTLTILCNDPRVAQGEMGQWGSAYRKCFMSLGQAIKNTTAGQAASSLINLG